MGITLSVKESEAGYDANTKGENKTKLAAENLLSKKVKVDLIISSHAIRAIHTAQIIAKKINYPEENIIIDKKIYASGIDNLFDTIFGIPNDFNCVILFGHNPTFTNIANYFLDIKIDNLPTSGLICVKFETDEWNEIIHAKKLENYVIFPKEL